MAEDKAQQLQSELHDRFEDLDWFNLERGSSCLDGWFTAEHLRAIADAMDKLSEAQNGKVQEEEGR